MSDPAVRLITSTSGQDVAEEGDIVTGNWVDESQSITATKWQASIESCGVTASSRSAAAKRMFDIVVALVALLITLPFYPLIFLAIYVDSGGPCIFRQVRIGRGGRPFIMYKFRSMYVSGKLEDEIYQGIVSKWISGTPLTPSHQESESISTGSLPGSSNSLISTERSISLKSRSGHSYKYRKDPRITLVGRFLRATSLDELPQFINVLFGDMSIVGPRPSIAYEVEHYGRRDFGRLLVKPGLTGLWQVKARGRANFQESIDLDIEYVSANSFWSDARLVVLTIPAVVFRKGAG